MNDIEESNGQYTLGGACASEMIAMPNEMQNQNMDPNVMAFGKVLNPRCVSD
jgi:hypothetical protein